MADDFLGIDEPTVIDKRIDAERLVVGANTVYRERVEVVGANALDVAIVTAANGLQVDVTRSALPIGAAIAANQTPTPTGINGGPVTVGTSEVELAFTGTTRLIAIKAASTNTGLIWFGLTGITNVGGDALGELTADQAVEIEIDDALAAIYVISDTAAQTVYKAGLT